MKHSEFYGPLTESGLLALIVNAPLYQAQNVLVAIKYDAQFGDGWYGDTAPEIAALARRWLDQIEDMDDMDYGRWIDSQCGRI